MSRLADAVDFVRFELSDDAVPSRRLFERARTAGIAEKTLRRALWALNARPRKLSGGRHLPWIWEPLLVGGKVDRYQGKRLPSRNWTWLPWLTRCAHCTGLTFDVSGLCPQCLRSQRSAS
jgi:hypothetical protein